MGYAANYSKEPEWVKYAILAIGFLVSLLAAFGSGYGFY